MTRSQSSPDVRCLDLQSSVNWKHNRHHAMKSSFAEGHAALILLACRLVVRQMSASRAVLWYLTLGQRAEALNCGTVADKAEHVVCCWHRWGVRQQPGLR